MTVWFVDFQHCNHPRKLSVLGVLKETSFMAFKSRSESVLVVESTLWRRNISRDLRCYFFKVATNFQSHAGLEMFPIITRQEKRIFWRSGEFFTTFVVWSALLIQIASLKTGKMKLQLQFRFNFDLLYRSELKWWFGFWCSFLFQFLPVWEEHFLPNFQNLLSMQYVSCTSKCVLHLEVQETKIFSTFLRQALRPPTEV